MSRIARGLILALFAAAGCGDKLYNDVASTAPGDAGAGGAVTYENQIKPILDTHCVSCHTSSLSGPDRAGAPAGFDFDTYQGAAATAVAANAEIQQGTMPLSAPLHDEEKRLFQQWIDNGLVASDCQCADARPSEVDGGEDE